MRLFFVKCETRGKGGSIFPSYLSHFRKLSRFSNRLARFRYQMCILSLYLSEARTLPSQSPQQGGLAVCSVIVVGCSRNPGSHDCQYEDGRAHLM